MRAVIIAATCVVMTSVAFSFGAKAGSMCGPRTDVLARLAEEFGEVPVFGGRHPSLPRRIAVTLNRDTGTWSVIVDDGATACVTAAGVAGAALDAIPGEDA